MTDFKQLTDKEYRAYPAESYSSIKHLLDSPATFLYYKSKPFEGSDSTLLGSAIHHFMQGNRHLVTFNHILRTSKERKLEYIEFEKNFRDLAGEDGIILPKSMEEKINCIMLNFNENDKAIKLLTECTFEEPFLFECNGVPLKGKIDGIKEDRVVEIKTSSQATDSFSFRREAKDRDYDLQAYLYLLASKKKHHYFLVANTVAPFKVSIYKSSNEFIEQGKQKAKIVTERYIKHILNGEPYVDEGIEEI
jgi:CRISPR/Cas system-associated exonuclease Cas4 (RecB family)